MKVDLNGNTSQHDDLAVASGEERSTFAAEADIASGRESMNGAAEERSRGKMQHGCGHYRRRCKLVAPCCGEVFWCRHCHNEVKSQDETDPRKRHELDRKAVRELICALCSQRQPVSPQCQHCHVSFGDYTCMTCVFFDDDKQKKQFHCDDCGICRVGGREKFFHCKTCGCCYDKKLQGKHICVQDSMKQNCPICFEFLFDSVQSTAVLNCGHTIHEGCLLSMMQNRQMSCPICMKTYEDMSHHWQQMDEEISLTPMPSEYANWKVDILCNDCNKASKVRFHILGLKCSHCRSYNTRRVKVQENQAELDARLQAANTAAQTDVLTTTGTQTDGSDTTHIEDVSADAAGASLPHN